MKYISSISSGLMDLCKRSEGKGQSSPVPWFESLYLPEVSIRDYLHRLGSKSEASPSCLVVMAIYLDRIQKKGVSITWKTVHRLMGTAFLVACKFTEDDNFEDAYFAVMIGVSTHELRTMERNFLAMLDFECFVTEECFDSYEQAIKI